jgi:hypothetical protein
VWRRNLPAHNEQDSRHRSHRERKGRRAKEASGTWGYQGSDVCRRCELAALNGAGLASGLAGLSIEKATEVVKRAYRNLHPALALGPSAQLCGRPVCNSPPTSVRGLQILRRTGKEPPGRLFCVGTSLVGDQEVT